MKDNTERKKNIYLSIGLILFALCVTGATYAYFALTASNNSLTGTVGGATLTLTVNKIVPTTQNTNMIPQLESTLGDAISNNYNCVDDHNNVICHVYKATITNSGQATAELKGLISFDYTTNSNYEVEDKIPNLKWKRITDATTLGEYNTYQALSTEQIFEEGKVFNPNASQEYYFVVWVNETGEEQSDNGVFRVNINFKSKDGDGLTSTVRPNYPLLSTAEVGSYIAYTGTNGCPSGHCDGTNANYVDDTNMGYCNYTSSKFTVNGWRVMSKDDGGVYLVSAGAPECMCTNSDGTMSNSNCDTYVSANDMDLHFNNLNNQARKYCNPLYAKGGVCNETTAWAMADADYQKVTGSTISACYSKSNESCGLNNSLIDNGGYYWYAPQYSSSSTYTSYWNPIYRRVDDYYSHFLYGVRPVLYLESDISIVGGSGTSEDPYQLENRKQKVLSDLEVGSYIAYTGTNGCPEGHCDGTNANYVDDTNMGYCESSSYKFTENGWRVMSKDDGGVYLVSAGAPECMCTNEDGTMSNSSCETFVSANDMDLHFNNLNNQARKYCNPLYAKGGVCNETTAWAMADADYQKVTGSTISACFSNSNESCGLNNSLIDNGGYYWYATQYSSSSTNAFYWAPTTRRVYNRSSYSLNGVRPVLYLESSILIVGGSGTYGDPYQLSAS